MKYLALIAFTTVYGVTPAMSATLTTVVSTANAQFVKPDGTLLQDTDSSSSGSGASTLLPPIITDNEEHSAFARLGSDGKSSVQIDSASSSGDDFRWEGEARTRITYNVTNPNLLFSINPTFNFLVDGLSAEIENGGGGGKDPFGPLGEDSGNPGFLMDYLIWVDGTLKYEARYEAYANVIGSNGLSLQVNENLNMTATPTPKTGFGGFVFGYDFAFDPLQGSIPLGPIAAGDSKSVTVSMIARTITPTNEADVSVKMGDPNDVGPSLGTDLPAIPLPASAFLLLGAMGGLGSVRVLRRTRT